MSVDLSAPVIAVMGPTATGKTALAMVLVDEFAGDIISVDSALVYRGMDIGTAKPDAAELARAPHRLIDIVDPDVAYSAGQFRRDALVEIDRSVAAGRVPVLAGGTMLYFRALLLGIDSLPDADAAVRAELEEQACNVGWPVLHAELAAIDPIAAARIHPNDAQRIQRALEVFRISGRPLSDWQRGGRAGLARPVLKIGLIPSCRDALHTRIESRFDAMLEAGLVDEVRQLRQRFDLTGQNPSMRAVGYRQVCAYLDGDLTLAQARADAITATRRLARRQLTWLRRESDLHVIDSEAPDVHAAALAWLRTRGVAR